MKRLRKLLTILLLVLSCIPKKETVDYNEYIYHLQHSSQNFGLLISKEYNYEDGVVDVCSQVKEVSNLPEGVRYEEKTISSRTVNGDVIKYQFEDIYTKYRVDIYRENSSSIKIESSNNNDIFSGVIKEPLLIIDDALTFLHCLDNIPHDRWFIVKTFFPERGVINNGRVLIHRDNKGETIYLFDGFFSYRIELNDEGELDCLDRSDGTRIVKGESYLRELLPREYRSLWLPTDMVSELSLRVEYISGLSSKTILIDVDEGDTTYSDLDNNEIIVDKGLSQNKQKTDIYYEICKTITNENLSIGESAERISEWIEDNIMETTASLLPEIAFKERRGSELVRVLIVGGMLDTLDIYSTPVMGLLYDRTNSLLRPSYWLLYEDEGGDERIINPDDDTSNSHIQIPLFYGDMVSEVEIVDIFLIDYETDYQAMFSILPSLITYKIESEGQVLGTENIEISTLSENTIEVDFTFNTVWGNSEGEIIHNSSQRETILTILSNDKNTGYKIQINDKFIYNPTNISTLYPILFRFPQESEIFSVKIINPQNDEEGTIIIKKTGEDLLWIDDNRYETTTFSILQFGIEMWIDEDGHIIKLGSGDFTYLITHDLS